MDRAQFLYKVATGDRSIGVLRQLVRMNKQALETAADPKETMKQLRASSAKAVKPPETPAVQTQGTQQGVTTTQTQGAATTPAAGPNARVTPEAQANVAKTLQAERDKKISEAGSGGTALAFLNSFVNAVPYSTGAGLVAGGIAAGANELHDYIFDPNRRPTQWMNRGQARAHRLGTLPRNTTITTNGTPIDVPNAAGSTTPTVNPDYDNLMAANRAAQQRTHAQSWRKLRNWGLGTGLSTQSILTLLGGFLQNADYREKAEDYERSKQTGQPVQYKAPEKNIPGVWWSWL